jgi:hypothetical protein
MDRWQLTDNGILWDVANDTRLPHSDHIEMSGRKVSVIVRYTVDENRRLSLTREIIWPTLRTKEGDVRGYLKRTYGDEAIPRFTVNGETLELGPIQGCELDGTLRFIYKTQRGVGVLREVYPSPRQSLVGESWYFLNQTSKPVSLHCSFEPISEATQGVYGEYTIETMLDWTGEITLKPNDGISNAVLYAAHLPTEPHLIANLKDEEDFRQRVARDHAPEMFQVSPNRCRLY